MIMLLSLSINLISLLDIIEWEAVGGVSLSNRKVGWVVVKD